MAFASMKIATLCWNVNPERKHTLRTSGRQSTADKSMQREEVKQTEGASLVRE